MDGVSWRILLEDLQVAYEQFAHGQTLQLLPKTTSFQRWSQHLQSYAQEQKIRDEFSYWYRFLQRDIVPLPVDNEHGQNTVDSVQTITFALSQEETRALLYEVPRAYRTQINDVLLTAFAQTIASWTRQDYIFFHLEGHGREALFEDVDLSRTVVGLPVSILFC